MAGRQKGPATPRRVDCKPRLSKNHPNFLPQQTSNSPSVLTKAYAVCPVANVILAGGNHLHSRRTLVALQAGVSTAAALSLM